MNFFTRRAGWAFVLAAAFFSALVLTGCGKDDNSGGGNPVGPAGPIDPVDPVKGFDSRLICEYGEAWNEGNTFGWVFRQNGAFTLLQKSGSNWVYGVNGTWYTSGNTLTVTTANTLNMQYSVSGSTMTIGLNMGGANITETWTKISGLSY